MLFPLPNSTGGKMERPRPQSRSVQNAQRQHLKLTMCSGQQTQEIYDHACIV